MTARFADLVPALISHARRLAAARLAAADPARSDPARSDPAQRWRKAALLWPLFVKE